MAGSSFGNLFRITTWGESHGKGIGVVVDGCPAGLSLCEEDIQKFLDRRKPSQSKFTTQRRESDTVEILSGVFEGKTTGTPISMMVWNKDQHSADYSEIASYYRPDMPISVLMKNTDFVITAAADAPRGAKRSDALPAVQLRSKF